MTSNRSRNGVGFGFSLLRIQCRIRKKIEGLKGINRYVPVWDRVPQYKNIWGEAAGLLGAEFLELADGVWEVRQGGRVTLLYNHIVQLDDPVILSLADNKPFCYRILEKERLPIPKFMTFRSDELRKARSFIEENGGFFVVKPAHGTSGGVGVTTHIKTYKECENAAALASLYDKEMIVERFIVGESYRILVLEDRIIHAARRRGIRLEGDGLSNIRQLVESENLRRRASGKKDIHAISVSDRDCEAALQARQIVPDSVLKKGETVLIRGNGWSDRHSEVRTVYDANVTHLLCREIRESAIQAARIIHSRFAGVDIITTDPTIPLEKSGGVINEINTTPGLHHHYDLSGNAGAPPAVDVLRHLLDVRPRACEVTSFERNNP